MIAGNGGDGKAISSSAPLKIAVFASGSGSNFQALAEAVRDGRVHATIELVVCDKPSAFVLERARNFGIETYSFSPKQYPSREAYEEEIVAKLQAHGIDLIVMAGYMRLVTNVLVEPYYGRMINVHPALLPAFPGINGIGQALEYGAKITGATVHFVDGGTDTGPIIAQQAVEIRDDDTAETLGSRIQQAEYGLLPTVVGWIAEGRVTLNGRKVTINN
ncbi:phosphoribosylglycinamide formyltransferase [Cohnella cholangitidis]|uniref:Phosphoribosylglycinamide formyltransferase n=1 Tax=Cohnella cholangitidis TaxID=2598458 RepID=A0A7G5BWK4_9BACL|nr:phosphoribosylglycinamide formyltransferase [Cohnella cholangitidis]QMV41338.1 phosphoribosylglycinamide formyltransferase [Cohnella cholangitidis]